MLSSKGHDNLFDVCNDFASHFILDAAWRLCCPGHHIEDIAHIGQNKSYKRECCKSMQKIAKVGKSADSLRGCEWSSGRTLIRIAIRYWNNQQGPNAIKHISNHIRLYHVSRSRSWASPCFTKSEANAWKLMWKQCSRQPHRLSLVMDRTSVLAQRLGSPVSSSYSSASWSNSKRVWGSASSTFSCMYLPYA